VVRAFARQDHESAKFAGRNARFRDLRVRLIWLMSVFWPSTDFLTIVQGGLILMLGAWWVSRGRMTVGTVFAFMAYANMFLWPVRQLGRILADVGQTTVSLGRLESILAVAREREPAPRAGAPERIEGRIVVRHLTFAHDGAAAALRDVSFEVEPGQTLAILGPSGSGKSTIVNLLLRFYDVTRGRILVNGVDIREMDLDDLRRLFSLVLQDVQLFSGTVAGNIRLGNAAITDDQVRQAAEAVHAGSFVDRLPQRFDTAVAERGATLSVGQKQLLSFARALAFDPQILVLDEATSSVDTETELLIRDALQVLMADRTTLAIAHRLSTIQDMDKILVLHKGELREAGSHQQLLAKRGIYYRLYQLQYKDQEARAAVRGQTG
jgi:ATP-binding cassette subfamily B protein